MLEFTVLPSFSFDDGGGLRWNQHAILGDHLSRRNATAFMNVFRALSVRF